MKNILGIDIGFSNLKSCAGAANGRPVTRICPAGAAPVDRVGTRFDGQEARDLLRVRVRDEEFLAGIAPDQANHYSHSLHAEYSTTDTYRALFHAGLLLSGMERIDELVTGLPVSQYFDLARRERLSQKMTGLHEIAGNRYVRVERVTVVPQPVGGLLDYISQTDVDLEDARILVVDPGFYSVDWVVIARGELQRDLSGSSLEAFSVVLQEAARLISAEHDSPLALEILEHALRRGKSHILMLGQRLELAGYIDRATARVAPAMVGAIQESLRTSGKMPDVVILVGGGADFFRGAVQAAFPRLRVETPREAVCSNARGYWNLGDA
ncbi:MAG: ParM/StbA family protein [Gammaproteobacteria bacterium]|nr:ParM/StbA family protein [Gammaproteobacteria bacterium]MBU1654762.1 ParM/StbA family protein [Gammaproteobacteria bacterium]MBU1959659.1 ParM/StbA family protein [Gammaproteobacteria bacterium]